MNTRIEMSVTIQKRDGLNVPYSETATLFLASSDGLTDDVETMDDLIAHISSVLMGDNGGSIRIEDRNVIGTVPGWEK